MSAAARRLAERVGQLCDGIFAEIEPMRSEVERELATGSPRRADLAIEGLCHDLLLGSAGGAAGSGLVMAPGVLTDAEYWLEWWTCDPDADPVTPKRLAVETDPSAVGFRDYTELPWYAVPFATGARHVTGPYVDYICTDQYTLTLTTPVLRDGRFVGVVGADLLVRTVEDDLFGLLQKVPGKCAVVNASGRVVCSTDPELITGDLVRGLPAAAWWAGEEAEHPVWSFTACGRLPLGVVER